MTPRTLQNRLSKDEIDLQSAASSRPDPDHRSIATARSGFFCWAQSHRARSDFCLPMVTATWIYYFGRSDRARNITRLGHSGYSEYPHSFEAASNLIRVPKKSQGALLIGTLYKTDLSRLAFSRITLR